MRLALASQRASAAAALAPTYLRNRTIDRAHGRREWAWRENTRAAKVVWMLAVSDSNGRTMRLAPAHASRGVEPKAADSRKVQSLGT